MPAGYDQFEFDLPGALLTHLIDAFNQLAAAPILVHIGDVPEEQGVYQLFLERKDGTHELVYIGKTDAEAGLRIRLKRHSQKIQHRHNLDPSKVHFKALRVFVFTAVDLEAQLIRHYNGSRWNGSGFGSNDPGKERDTTVYKPEHFDTQYPIDLDRPLAIKLPASDTAAAYLQALKRELPYLIRFERIGRTHSPHADLAAVNVSLDPLVLATPRSVIEQVLKRLPSGWHATALPSHVIIYKNDTRRFPSGIRVATSP